MLVERVDMAVRLAEVNCPLSLLRELKLSEAFFDLESLVTLLEGNWPLPRKPYLSGKLLPNPYDQY